MFWQVGDYHKYARFIADAEKRHFIPRNLLAIVLFQASAYDPDIIAGKGQHPLSVVGIAKLTPEQAFALWGEQLADTQQRHDAPTKRRDAHASIIGAASILDAKRERFGNWTAAILAYHTSDEIAAATMRDNNKLPIDGHKYVAQAQHQLRLQ